MKTTDELIDGLPESPVAPDSEVKTTNDAAPGAEQAPEKDTVRFIPSIRREEGHRHIAGNSNLG